MWLGNHFLCNFKQNLRCILQQSHFIEMKVLINLIVTIISLLINLIRFLFLFVSKLFTYNSSTIKKPNIQKPEIISTDLDVSRLVKNEEENAIDYALKCERRGRYELALEFQKIGAKWYERNIVKKSTPYETKEDKNRYRVYLREFRGKLKIYPHLVNVRDNLRKIVENYPGGIDRKLLLNLVEYKGYINFGAFCNQLEKGGWIKQIKKGKNIIVMPPDKKVIIDSDFLRLELFR